MTKKKPVSVSDVAKKGGEATLKKHGKEHYQKIARKRWDDVKKK